MLNSLGTAEWSPVRNVYAASGMPMHLHICNVWLLQPWRPWHTCIQLPEGCISPGQQKPLLAVLISCGYRSVFYQIYFITQKESQRLSCLLLV